MKSYTDRIYELQDELWKKFDLIVKSGAKFPTLIGVEYPFGINPPGLIKTTEDRSYFLAKEIKSNPNYVMNIGEDLIVETGAVVFIGTDDEKHKLEPDVVDLHWLAELVDAAELN